MNKKSHNPLHLSKLAILDLVEKSLREAGVTTVLKRRLVNRIEKGLATKSGDTVEQEFAYELLYSFRHLLQHGIEHFGARPGRKFELVDIETFVCSPEYMGQKDFVRPAIMSELKRLFESDHDRYHEVVCLQADTQLILGDGTKPTIRELAESPNAAGPFWIWGYDKESIKLTQGCNACMTRSDAEIWRVTFTDGTYEEATPDHIFYVKGEPTRLRDLKKGNSLTSFYAHKTSMYGSKNFYWRMYYPSIKKYGELLHRIIARDYYGDTKDKVVHHKNLDSLDNRLDNLSLLTPSEHSIVHNDIAVKNINAYNTETSFEIRSKNASANASKSWNNSTKERHRKAALRLRKRNLGGLASIAAHSFWDSLKGQKERKKMGRLKAVFNKTQHPHLRLDLKPEHLIQIAPSCKVFKDLPEGLNCSATKVYSLLEEMKLPYPQFRDEYMPSSKGQHRKIQSNHKVLRVEYTGRHEPVYCLSVPKTNNFFIQVRGRKDRSNTINSVLSKNCGGGIGIGKNYFADMALAYLVYDLSSFYSPQLEFGLAPGSSIVLMMQSASIKLAKSVLFNQFKARISLCPYFVKNFPFDKKVRTELRFPNDIIITPLSSTDTAALGLNIWGGVIDELSFMPTIIGSKKGGKEGSTYDQAETLYNTVIRRMESRFMILGKIPGKLFLIGSANYPGNFIDRKIQGTELKEAAGEKVTTFVMNMSQWESLPADRFSGKTFRVELPSENSGGRVLAENEESTAGAEVRNVPIEYKERFVEDFDGSMRDIVGIPVGTISKFIRNIDKIMLAAEKHDTIFESNQLFSSDIIDQRLIHTDEDMVNMDYLINRLDPHTRMGIHIDLALTGDSLGIAVGRVFGFTKAKSKDLRSTTEETLPIFCIDGASSIIPPPNREIDLFAVRDLVLFLKKHINIVFVTMDSYESAMMMQSFRTHRISSTVQSVDRTTQPYKDLKTAILTERIMYPNNPTLLKEIKSLIHDPRTDKIDHPARGGSKDVSDCVASLIYRFASRKTSYRMGGESGRPKIAGNRPRGTMQPHGTETETRRVRTSKDHGRLI